MCISGMWDAQRKELSPAVTVPLKNLDAGASTEQARDARQVPPSLETAGGQATGRSQSLIQQLTGHEQPEFPGSQGKLTQSLGQKSQEQLGLQSSGNRAIP